MSFYDATVRHAIYIERYKARVVREILDLLGEVEGDLFTLVAQSDLERMTRRDLDRLLAAVNRVVTDGYGPINQQIEDALRSFGVYEAEWTVQNLLRAGLVTDIGIPSDADLWSAMYSRPFQGRLLREWLRDLPANTSQRVRQAIRQGYVDGLGPVAIARQLRGTRANPGVLGASRRGVEAMVRTAIAHTSSASRDRTYRQNSAITGVQWVSVLDHRTSEICRHNDGRVGPVEPDPTWRAPRGFEVLQPRMARPPAHIACRSTVVPITRGNAAALRTRPTYNDWLTRQPASVQDDVLGPSRGRLFREGNFTVDRFSDPTGQQYTLDELRARDAAAFDEVFAD